MKKEAYLPVKADRPSPHSEQVPSAVLMPRQIVMRLVGVDQLAVNGAENGAVAKMKQRNDSRRVGAELETEQTGAGKRRDRDEDDQRHAGCKDDAAQEG